MIQINESIGQNERNPHNEDFSFYGFLTLKNNFFVLQIRIYLFNLPTNLHNSPYFVIPSNTTV